MRSEKTIGHTTFTSSRFESGGEEVLSHLFLRSLLLSVFATGSVLTTSICAGLLQLGQTCGTKGSELGISHGCVVSGWPGDRAAMRLERGKRSQHLVVAVSCPSSLLHLHLQFSAVTSAAFTMSSLKLHPSLPTSVTHVGASLQAKSSVLTGVQDAYWSDEEVRSKNTFIAVHTQLIT